MINNPCIPVMAEIVVAVTVPFLVALIRHRGRSRPIVHVQIPPSWPVTVWSGATR